MTTEPNEFAMNNEKLTTLVSEAFTNHSKYFPVAKTITSSKTRNFCIKYLELKHGLYIETVQDN